MDEQKEIKSENTEAVEAKAEATPSNEVGKPSEAEEAIVVKAKEAADAQKTENDRKAELLEREEALMKRKEALAALGGGSPAGDKPATAEETPQEYKDKVLAGEVGTKE